MTGSGGFGGYAPFRLGSMALNIDLREFEPSARELVDAVLDGLSPKRVLERALAEAVPSNFEISDNTQELYLSTTQPDIDELFKQVSERADVLGIKYQQVESGKGAGERRIYVTSDKEGALASLVNELKQAGVSFFVDEVLS